MKHASQVIELLGAYPGRKFRMRQIVQYVAGGTPLDPKRRHAMRVAIREVLSELSKSGSVVSTSSGKTSAWYAWRDEKLIDERLAA